LPYEYQAGRSMRSRRPYASVLAERVRSSADRECADAWQNSVCGFLGIALRRSGDRGQQSRHPPQKMYPRQLKPGRDRRAAGQSGRVISSLVCRRSSSPILRQRCRAGTGAKSRNAQRTAAQDQGREQLRRFLAPGRGYQPSSVRMFHQ
jgi:conjugal transfer/entry exclusion protein